MSVRSNSRAGSRPARSRTRSHKLAARYDVRRLFPNAEQGHWFDRDILTRYQESTGVTPAVVAQPEGFIGDKRRGFVRGPELLLNGDFSAGATNWTVSGTDATHIATFAGGTCRYQSDTTAPVLFLAQAVDPLVVGKTYEITTVTSAWTSGSLKTDCFTTANLGLAGGVGTSRVIAVASTAVFSVIRNSANVDITIDSISIRMIDGNHAIQATAAARPTLSARVNQAPNSETVASIAPWNCGNFVIENNALACPSGPALLTKLTATATPAATAYTTTAPALPFTVSFYAHSGSRTGMDTLVRNGTTATAVSSGVVYANGTTAGPWTATAVGGDIYRVQAVITTGFTAGDILQIYYGATGAVTPGLFWYVGGMQVDLGSTVGRYQRVTTATDYDTVGFPFFDSLDGTQQHTTSTTGGGSTAGLMYCQAISPQGGAGTNRTIFDDGTYRVRINAANKLELGSAKTVTYGPELVTNGTFTTDTTGWTFTNCTGMVVTGQLVLTSTVASGAVSAAFNGTVVQGKTYATSINCVSRTGITNGQIYLSGFVAVAFSTTGIFTGDIAAAGGTLAYTLVATASAIGQTITFDDASAKEKISHHLVETAATVAVGAVAVATVWQEPRALVNLLLATANFTDTSQWANSGVTVVTPSVAPDGTSSIAYIETPTATSGGLYELRPVSPLTQYTFSFLAKRGSATAALLRLRDNTNALDIATTIDYYSEINATNLTLVSRTFTTPAGCVAVRTYVQSDQGGGTPSGAFVWRPQLELGPTATTYQRVGATTADFDNRMICAQLANGTIARTGCIAALAGGPGYAVGRDYATATSHFFGRLYPSARVCADVVATSREQAKKHFASQAGIVL